MFDKKIIDRLFDHSIESDPAGKAKISAAIVRRNEIISIANNSMKTHPFQKKFGKNKDSIHLHAEIYAILKALKKIEIEDLAKCDLYIARSKKNNEDSSKGFEIGLAKPCAGCMRAISTFGIKNVYYTDETTTEGYNFL